MPPRSKAIGARIGKESVKSGSADSDNETMSSYATGLLKEVQVEPAVVPQSSQQHIGDADFKDTVLYMQQQQAMHHAELLGAMQSIAKKLDEYMRAPRVGGPGAESWGAPSSQPATAVPGPTTAPLLGSSYVVSQVMNSSQQMEDLIYGPSTDSIKDAEIRAARSRITSLEEQVEFLKKQVDSKERTIQRLTEASARTNALRIPNPGLISVTQQRLTPKRDIDQHQYAVGKVFESATTPDHRGGAMSNGFASPGSVSTSIDLMQRLKLHQDACMQMSHR